MSNIAETTEQELAKLTVKPPAPKVTKDGEYTKDEHDVPVYSARQLERIVELQVKEAKDQMLKGGAASETASTGSFSLATVPFEELMNEVDRRKQEAKTALSTIPTDLLEVELISRKKSDV